MDILEYIILLSVDSLIELLTYPLALSVLFIFFIVCSDKLAFPLFVNE